jgi:hypothetical protein
MSKQVTLASARTNFKRSWTSFRNSYIKVLQWGFTLYNLALQAGEKESSMLSMFKELVPAQDHDYIRTNVLYWIRKGIKTGVSPMDFKDGMLYRKECDRIASETGVAKGSENKKNSATPAAPKASSKDQVVKIEKATVSQETKKTTLKDVTDFINQADQAQCNLIIAALQARLTGMNNKKVVNG